MLIHQMLHGYSQGHNLLASSIILPYEEDMDQVFNQSDWDEYTSPYDSDLSYVTIYPLKKSGYLVVAKSWYANEMDRPGCVWTQSLLIKIDEIEQEFNFEELLNVFRRPERDKYELYRMPIMVNSVDFRATPLSPTICAKDISMLMEKMTRGITGMTYSVEMASKEYQKLVLRLIQYLPTQFLYEVSLCSGTLLQRKIDGHSFSVQFNPQMGQSLSAYSKEGKEEVLDFWGTSVHDDIRSVFKLMRLFSNDISGSFEKLMATLRLICLLVQAYQEGKEVKLEEILDIILTSYPTKEDGAIVKQNFLRQSVVKIFCKERYFIYLLSTIQMEDAIDYDAIEFGKRTDDLANNDSAGEYQHLIIDLLTSHYLNEKGKHVLQTGIPLLRDETVKNLAQTRWEDYLGAVRAYHELIVKYPIWIDFEKNKFREVYAIFSRQENGMFKHVPKLVKKLLDYDIDFSRDVNLGYYSRQQDIVNLIWDYYNHVEKYRVLEGAHFVTQKMIDDFIQWIGTQINYSFLVNQYIVQHIIPDSEIIKYRGSDIWIGWMNSLKNNLVIINDVNYDYYTFLFLLSFNWQDENALNYLKLSFNRLHFIFSTGYEDQQVWKPLKPFLYGFWWWEYWDKCKLLRVSVVRYLISIGKQVDTLNDFCDTLDLTRELREIWDKEMK